MSCIKEQAEEQYECEVISDIHTWPTAAQSGSNSQLFYIAVEYVNSNELTDSSLTGTISQQSCADFVINPLESNSECYPVEIQCQGGGDYGGIIIQEFNSEENTQHSEGGFSASNQLVRKSGMLEKQDNLELIPSIVMSQNDSLQFASSGVHQEVELLITDQASVNAQELLVENCLNNEQLLLMPSMLESESISLYPTSTGVLENYIVTPVVTSETSPCERVENGDVSSTVEEKRPQRHINNVEEEVGLFSCLFSIEDKPVLSRARASLPEFYLSLNKVVDEDAVFAKKVIPKRTQFGPLKGSLSEFGEKEKSDNSFLVNVAGKTHKIVVSDESVTNWMAFVRRATTYEEQNLIVTQEEGSLYFTTVRNILPKEELKVGYSLAYAGEYNLEVLKPAPNKSWPCFECSEKFATSNELQDHVDIHDLENDENLRPKKRNGTKKLKSTIKSKKSQIEIVECNVCQAVLNGGIGYLALKRHIVDYHKSSVVNIADHFTILKGYQCTVCNVRFKLELLLNIHKLEHNLELPLDQPNHVCPQCQRKFPTRKQLVLHVSTHALPQIVPKSDSFKCHICYKAFAYSFRLQKHMLCHGSDDNKPLQCKICQKRFLTKAALAFHVKVHKRGEKHFGCVICKERFDHVIKLRLHVPEHADNNLYSCPHCSKTFSSYRFVRKHVRFHNAREHHCPECSKSFTTTDNLKKHRLRHSDHKEFLCADCGKQFKRKDKLSDHIKKLHLLKGDSPVRKSGKMGEKTLKEPLDFHRFIYKCNLCVIGFKRRGMLVNHLAKRHPDVRPDSVPELNLPILQTMKDYICLYCDKVYKSSSKRKQHVLKIHPGEPLPNDKGKWTAPPPVNVTTRPKNCQWCHRQYARRSKLLQHIRKAHPSKILDEPDEGVDKLADPPSTTTNTVASLSVIPKEEQIGTSEYTLNRINSDYSSMAQKNKITTDGNITEITPIESLMEEAKYCHLSIDETEILGNGDELMNSGTHLFQLMNANNGKVPFNLYEKY